MSYVVIILIVLLIKRFVFTPIRVSGDSMKPNLLDGEVMFLNEIGYHLNGVKRFDIVVVEKNDDKLIKRVVGLPGETIKYVDNKLYINGEVVEEPFEHKDTPDFSLEALNLKRIPKGYYFVIGDNRTNSLDSRQIGLIKKSEIRGKTNFIIYPFKKWGKVQQLCLFFIK